MKLIPLLFLGICLTVSYGDTKGITAAQASLGNAPAPAPSVGADQACSSEYEILKATGATGVNLRGFDTGNTSYSTTQDPLQCCVYCSTNAYCSAWTICAIPGFGCYLKYPNSTDITEAIASAGTALPECISGFKRSASQGASAPAFNYALPPSVGPISTVQP